MKKIEPRRDLDMKVTLNNVDIELSLRWRHKYALVNFELQRKRVRTGQDMNIKAGELRIPCQHQVHKVLSKYMQCVSSSPLQMAHRRAYEESPLTRPD